MISWKKTPALFVALLFLIGYASAFFLPFLLLTFCTKRRLFWLFPLLAFFLFKSLYLPLPTEETGTAQFHIDEVKRHAGPVKMTWVYRGTLLTFEGDKRYHKIPVSLYLPLQKKRPPATMDYTLQGTLTKISTGHYLFKAKGEWIPIEQTTSRAEWRFQQKEKVKQWVHSRFQEKKVATLLSALATGHLESRYLAYHFNQVGLQHLLAISGFHFALLSFFLWTVLKRFLPERWMALLLMILLSFYFI